MIDDAWKLFLEGDDKSFSKIYHAYYSELLAYALNLGFDDERSKDAIQDIFFNIYISRKKLNHISTGAPVIIIPSKYLFLIEEKLV
jgi:DNA-directed RNA polymerase specialized sigma24 family protein